VVAEHASEQIQPRILVNEEEVTNEEYRTRRKKCDEKKPACARCIQGGWHCDFLFVPMHERTVGASTVVGIVEAYNLLRGQENDVASWTDTSYVGSPEKISVLPSHLRNLHWLQAGLFDYFRAVCAPEFSLYFMSNDWDRLVLQTVYSEPWALKAALSISTLSRNHYTPEQINLLGASAFEYAMVCYNQAIVTLNSILGTSVNGSYFAVIGAILFVTIEFLQQTLTSASYPKGGVIRGHIQTHIQGGFAILRNAQPQNDLEYLAEALTLLQYQEQQFHVFHIANQQ
jgi:hypothetical protein